jgi:hypothetical protein
MEKEILKQILSQLESFKSEQLWLLIILFLLFLIISIFQAVYTSKLVDKYRNELKKNELKFSIFNELQIKQLSILFELTNNLKSISASIYGYIKDSDSKSLNLKEWDNIYREFNTNYSANSYIIPKNMKVLILEYSKNSHEFNCNIHLLKEKHGYDSIDMSDDEKTECLVIIEKEIYEYKFEKEILNIMIFCEKLKESIDEYFETLE